MVNSCCAHSNRNYIIKTMTAVKQQRIRRRRQKQCFLQSSQQQCYILWTVQLLFLLLLMIIQPQVTICQQQQQQRRRQRQQEPQTQQQNIPHHQQRKLQNDENLGNLATLNLEPFTPNVSYRQNVCDRYDAFRNGTMELRHALNGLELHPVIAPVQYFKYDSETGINPDDPGLMGTLLDKLAERAGFTWRDSFAILGLLPANKIVNNITRTKTDLLVWSVDTYDISINYWDQSIERMERGIAYLEPWFDASVILIYHEDPPKDATINLFNWLRPFHTGVWMLIVATIIVSGFVHQLIEYLNDERNERSFWQWFWDNSYLSWLTFTQNYEYAPNSLSGRIFGISMGIWALVISATYTANLASLLVEQKVAPTIVDSIDKAIVSGIPICTYGGTNADTLIKRRYKDAIRVPKSSELEGYEALRRGECGLLVGYKDNWLDYRGDRRYNPECDLEWVGRTIETVKSGFVTKADSGHLCSSLIRDVLNLHLTEMIRDGILEEAWETHRATSAGANAIDCVAGEGDSSTNGEEDSSARFLRDNREQYPSESETNIAFGNRKLKGGGNSAASSSGGGNAEGERLTIQQMAGIFVLHYVMMVVAVLVSAVDRYLRIQEQNKAAAAAIKKCEKDIPCDASPDEKNARYAAAAAAARTQLRDRRVSFRTHGPIIGSAPPVNTYMKTETSRPVVTFQKFHGNDHYDFSSEALQETCPEGTESPSFGASLNGAANSFDMNDKSITISEGRINDFETSILTTQQELKSSHEKMQYQMNKMMCLMEEMYRKNGGSEIIFLNDAQDALAELSGVIDGTNKDHRD